MTLTLDLVIDYLNQHNTLLCCFHASQLFTLAANVTNFLLTHSLIPLAVSEQFYYPIVRFCNHIHDSEKESKIYSAH